MLQTLSSSLIESEITMTTILKIGPNGVDGSDALLPGADGGDGTSGQDAVATTPAGALADPLNTSVAGAGNGGNGGLGADARQVNGMFVGKGGNAGSGGLAGNAFASAQSINDNAHASAAAVGGNGGSAGGFGLGSVNGLGADGQDGGTATVQALATGTRTAGNSPCPQRKYWR